jgi:fused signal recognition particle receptor
MFNLLKNKFSNFVDAVAKKITGKVEEEAKKEEIKKGVEEEVKSTGTKPVEIAKPAPKILEKKEEEVKKEIGVRDKEVEKPLPQSQVTQKPSIPQPSFLSQILQPKPKPQPAEEVKPSAVSINSSKPSETTEKIVEESVEVKPTLLTKLKGLVMPEVVIKEGDVKNVIDDFELQLLEADVALPVAEFIKDDLRKKMIGKNIKYSDLDRFVKESITQTLFDLLKQESFDIVSFIRSKKKPVKILFLGPNGHGKTTTIAKFVHMLQKNGFSCVISASDTFRAAAIEQTMEHAERLGVTAIKHQYGADPTAVAFDAIKHAEAKGIDVVLIDTAGRQETDRNLIEQLKKISRVVNPDLKLFVVEGIVGNAVIEQVTQFNAAIPLNGVILTKIDCDAKGGTAISIKKATGIPVLYLGVGQGYDDLVPFTTDYIVSRLMT